MYILKKKKSCNKVYLKISECLTQKEIRERMSQPIENHMYTYRFVWKLLFSFRITLILTSLCIFTERVKKVCLLLDLSVIIITLSNALTITSKCVLTHSTSLSF